MQSIDYARHPAPPRRGGPFCKPEELESSSRVFSFAPDQFQRAAIYLDGQFSRDSGVVTIDRSLEEVSDSAAIQVNVTLFAGRPELLDEVNISGFDKKGQYNVEVKRNSKGRHHHHHHHHQKRPSSKEDCLTYHIHVVFPSNLETFESLDLRIKAARWIGTHDGDQLSKLEFGKVRAGLGHGPIGFSNMKAKHIMLATLHGAIKGSYHPTERLSAAAVRGTTDLTSLGSQANVTAVSLLGPASATLSADHFKGNFIVSSLTGGPTVKAPNPQDVHIERNRFTFKAGYYKEKDTGYHVIVHSKHGDSNLNFK
ncbi:hypothetical protein BX666DRAFT_1863781 [Dichotomocladium elegans]|nr:hypothetical protein BX666DRAFT_1863781 [Dichotomocladium elegans]